MEARIVYSVVVPVYNEEEVIQKSYRRLTDVMEMLGECYELIFVNDGSQDKTLQLLQEVASLDANVRILDFSRNFGHQIAITAGMDASLGEAVVVIDADLQDPPELIPVMIEKWKQGYEVVYAKRRKRKGESWFKRVTALAFYRILRAMTNVDIPVDTGDFRLIDRVVCQTMSSIKEKNRFVRGLVSWVGFKQIAVEYDRDERAAGETKYPLRKMLKLSVDAMTSFSEKPLKLASYAGFAVSAISFIGFIVTICMKLFTDSTVAGWASLLCTVLFMNGILLIILGIIGEYIGRIYDESKDRPLYIVSKRIGYEHNSSV
ncbi:glycosyltransferase family 2 protein [Paenibacillus roseipurpureus]|uniref:Glycosyltransferase family 2 protein n=1 Tax=Paenibacillus roseopurpureus TaxID=2918901 RepID=A0AA96RK89_9BACL|nr:glycosyltransferase family 2 protein [Paenibacillus sp. MBLB1832]WNR44046.1 glycosyltransferase family 2 protein [Paenibacillus sp. MBLB1832]